MGILPDWLVYYEFKPEPPAPVNIEFDFPSANITDVTIEVDNGTDSNI